MGRSLKFFDWINIVLLTAIACFGLFLLLTIREQLFFQQLAFIIVGILLAFFVSRVDGIALRYLSPYLYIVSILLLALTYVSRLTPEIRGASRWIILGPLQLQPSELVKPFFLLFFATFMANYPPRKWKNIPYHLILFLLPFLLVFEQPDLGTSFVYLGSWFAMLFVSGFPFVLLVIGGILAVGVAPFLWHHLEPFQKLRITTFLNPGFDPKGAGYNAFQAMIAVGSGQLFGRGLGRGTQSHLRFLPEFHTDFIFATLIEELGFLGGLLLFFLYAMLLWRLLRPLLEGTMSDTVVFLYSLGFFTMLLIQIGINTGMNMGIIPVTGITLPLVSYGGSSILSICVSYGILLSLKRASHEDNVAIRA